MPSLPRSGLAWTTARVVGTVAFIAYFVVVLSSRMHGAASEWAVDGDQPQAVWHYWRYHVDGALPPGHLFTDYAFVMHAPPLWWLMMATLSTFVTPILAAKILHVLSFVLLAGAITVVVGRRSEWLLGLAAAALAIRNPDLTTVMAGGYARSFGPFLTVAFAGAFLEGRHRLCLILLVVQAALYPSVVVACGITYGVYVVLRGPMHERIRRVAGMFVAGLLVIAFGMFQSLSAPKWWGSVVSAEEAKTMPAWGPGGRTPDIPMNPPFVDIEKNIMRAYRPDGAAIEPLRQLSQHYPWVFVSAPLLLSLAVVTVDRVRRRRRRGPSPEPDEELPWQLLAMALGTLAAFALARLMAYRLYLPYRVLTHLLPYLLYVGVPLTAWAAARAILGTLSGSRRAAAVAIAVVVAVVPVFVARGTGISDKGRSYVSYEKDQPVWQRLRKLPKDAVIACSRYYCDYMPVFSYHRAYSSKNLAHPFRRAYYEETERRLLENSKALFANTLQEVVDFGEREGVDYFLYSTSSLKKPDRRFFEPIRKKVKTIFNERKDKGFALKTVPAEAIAWKRKGVILVDLKKLGVFLKNAVPAPAPETGDLAEGANTADE